MREPKPKNAASVAAEPIVLYAGGPCSCRPGRYVRFIIPAVPGCVAAVHCRDLEAAREGLATHAIPAGAVVALHMPRISNEAA